MNESDGKKKRERGLKTPQQKNISSLKVQAKNYNKNASACLPRVADGPN